MAKRILLFSIIFLSLVCFSGCETIKGAAAGLGTTVAGTADGAAKDTQHFWQAMLKTDTWIKENLW